MYINSHTKNQFNPLLISEVIALLVGALLSEGSMTSWHRPWRNGGITFDAHILTHVFYLVYSKDSSSKSSFGFASSPEEELDYVADIDAGDGEDGREVF